MVESHLLRGSIAHLCHGIPQKLDKDRVKLSLDDVLAKELEELPKLKRQELWSRHRGVLECGARHQCE